MKLEIAELKNGIEATKAQISALNDALEENKTQLVQVEQDVANAKVHLLFYS